MKESDTDWTTFFDKIAPRYTPLTRYSRKCMNTGMSIFSNLMGKKDPMILDVGCGTGYPSKVLSRILPSSDIHLLDISSMMLKKTKESWPSSYKLPSFLQCDAVALPLRNRQFDAVLSSCMIVNFPIRTMFFKEMKRVLKPKGILFIMTYDPDDLESQIFHKYFPKYLELDRSRHAPISQLCHELNSASFKVLDIIKIPYQFFFKTQQQLLSFVSTKPFSTFAKYGEKEFQIAFSSFSDNIKNQLPTRKILNKCQQTCIAALLQ